MLEIIIALVSVVLMFISMSLCFAVCDKFISERNIFRDKWIDEVEHYNGHLVDENYYLREELDELKAKDTNDEEEEE